MLIFRTEGLTCPEVLSTARRPRALALHAAAGFRSATPSPLRGPRKNWLESYKPEELFDANGAVMTTSLPSSRRATYGATPNANGGVIRNDLS